MIKNFALGIGIIAVASAFIWLGMKTMNLHSDLKKNGTTIQGTVQGATTHSINFIPTRYSLQVRYLGNIHKFYVSRSLFNQYVQDDEFEQDAPIDVIYLQESPHKAELAEMIDVWFFWIGGPYVYFIFGLLMLIGAIGCIKKGITLGRNPEDSAIPA